jgi:ketosteroid isomerase-like protein
MRATICFLLLAVSIGASAQADSLLKQINEQVWKPFIQAFNTYDSERFMSVHSPEVTRVIRDGNQVFGFEEYKRQHSKGDREQKSSNFKRTLELRFTQRIAANDRAFETGYFQFIGVRSNGEQVKAYGRFHVLLRKENGTWKILMDSDAREDANEQNFMKAKPLE